MGIPFLLVYFLALPALCVYTLYRFARLWLWSAPILATLGGTAMLVVYLGGSFAGEGWLTAWGILMPIQQTVAISLTLGALVGKVPGCLGPEMGSVPEAVLLLQSACSPFAGHKLTCADWFPRHPGQKI